MKIIVYIYILLSVAIFIFSVGKLLSKYIRLKYGSDELSLLGEDSYAIIKIQVVDMIGYIYVVGVYVLLSIVFGIFALKNIKYQGDITKL